MTSKERWTEEAEDCEVELCSCCYLFLLHCCNRKCYFIYLLFSFAPIIDLPSLLQGINHKDAERVPVVEVRDKLDEQFRRVIAPKAFQIDTGKPP